MPTLKHYCLPTVVGYFVCVFLKLRIRVQVKCCPCLTLMRKKKKSKNIRLHLNATKPRTDMVRNMKQLHNSQYRIFKFQMIIITTRKLKNK